MSDYTEIARLKEDWQRAMEAAAAKDRLNAAAPDLLAALKGLLAPDGLSVYATEKLIAAARAAIAKAEGTR